VVGFTGRIKDITTIKGYHQEIEKQRQFYENILNKLPSEIGVMNGDGKYVFMNKTAIKDDALRKWIIGKDDLEYTIYRNKPRELGLKRMAYQHMATTEKRKIYFEEVFDVLPEKKYYARSLTPVYDEKGDFLYTICYGYDVSDLKRKDSIIDNLPTALDLSNECVVIVDFSKVTYANKAVVNMLGFSTKEQIIGMNWTDLWKEKDADKFDAFRSEIRNNGRAKSILPVETLNGKSLTINVEAILLRDNFALCLFSDITADLAQKNELQKLATALNKSSSLTIITDSDMKIEWVNEGFTYHTGYTADEVKGLKPMREVLNKKLTMDESKNISDFISTKKYTTGELPYYDKAGNEKWMQFNVTAVTDEKGDVTHYIGIHNDITAIKAAELALQKSLEKERKLNEFKSQFIRLASHELRTPLTGIQTSTDIISTVLERDNQHIYHELKPHMHRISDQVERLDDIMKNILLAGKNEAGQSNFNPELGYIDAFVMHCTKQMARYENDIYHHIQLDIEGTSREQEFDRRMIEHCLSNLLSNAVKYSTGKPNPVVRVLYTDVECQISVRDFGIGIPDTDRDMLFHSFFRAHNVENIPGVGLGLTLVKQFIELHGGTVTFESELNKGSCFVLHLPYKHYDHESAA
jgi:PAS domain S-box-containing protein